MNLNGSALAYLGDSFYEHQIRSYLISLRLTKTSELHKRATNFTSATAQAKIIKYLKENILTEEEVAYYKKGRNVSHPGRKNISSNIYHEATGFESLIGYLSITDEKRALELIKISILYIEESYGKEKET
ncbi:MAG: Mini-ribonuclease 3 [Acholeplasmataceae bacterium]|nr:Mini-ribonuclease 3 [Acholeplasmataceae bacterium]